jgi:hypothetical protein
MYRFAPFTRIAEGLGAVYPLTLPGKTPYAPSGSQKPVPEAVVVLVYPLMVTDHAVPEARPDSLTQMW